MDKIVTIDVSEPYFTLLRKGKKRVEGKKGSEKWRSIKEGDVVIFRKAVESQNSLSETKTPGTDGVNWGKVIRQNLGLESTVPEYFKAKVMKINRYGSIDPLGSFLKGETVEAVLPNVKEMKFSTEEEKIEWGRNVYLNFFKERPMFDYYGEMAEIFDKYALEKAKTEIIKCGMLAFYVQRVFD